MDRPSHLLALYVVTKGLQGDFLGTDEEQITWLSYTIIDVRENKEVAQTSFIVEPFNIFLNDFPKIQDGDDSSINDRPRIKSFISEAALVHAPDLTEQMIRNNGIPLDEIIKKANKWILLQTCEQNIISMQLVVDGQAAIRQCLHPEACKKLIKLDALYHSFFDLRKEFSTCYSKRQKLRVSGIKQMMQLLDLPPIRQLPKDCYVGEAIEMVLLVNKIIADGCEDVFHVPEQISTSIPDAVLPLEEAINDHIVMIRVNPNWPLCDWEIHRFFKGLNIIAHGVIDCYNRQPGRSLGDNLICFESKEHKDMALQRNNHFIGQICIEVLEGNSRDYLVFKINRIITEDILKLKQESLNKLDSSVSITNAKEVVQFFDSLEKPCQLLNGEEGVLFVISESKNTKYMLALFVNEEEAIKARIAIENMDCGKYKPIFFSPSTTYLAQQALDKCTWQMIQDRLFLPTIKIPRPMKFYYRPPDYDTSELSRYNWIHLENLPREISLQDIQNFFGKFICKNIAKDGIHMQQRNDDKPTIQAYMKLTHEDWATECRTLCRSTQLKLNGERYKIVARKRSGRQVKEWRFKGREPRYEILKLDD